MKYTSLRRRLLGGATALGIGVIGAIAMASPASAHHPIVSGNAVCDETTGEWVITWTVKNSEHDLVGEITAVTVTPDDDISPIAVGAVLPESDEGELTAEQRVGSEVTAASLEVSVKWLRGKKVIEKTKSADATGFEGECVPSTPPSTEPAPPSPSPSAPPMQEEESGFAEAQFNCEVFSLTLTNDADDDLTVFVVPSVGETVEVTIPGNGTSEPIEFPASEGLTVDVQIVEGESALEEGPLEITSEAWAELNCEDDGQGGELPTTGSSTPLIVGGALALLALGAGLFLIARRRRVTFTA